MNGEARRGRWKPQQRNREEERSGNREETLQYRQWWLYVLPPPGFPAGSQIDFKTEF
jgi:hypothetical protein